jgi:ubiquinone/menaquinone biosynthesis C-methylase UbiE
MIEKQTDVQYWPMSQHYSQLAQNGMDNSALIEEERVINGELISSVHSQALRDYDEIKRLIDAGFELLESNRKPITGDAADLGSGTGIGATILSLKCQINTVYAIEFSREFVERIMPVVFNDFNADKSKIVRVVGDFNNLKLEDNSLSVIVEIDSYHHSENMDLSLNESYRVLKPGGVIISIDRAWPDSISDQELNQKLDQELNDNLRSIYRIPSTKRLTRREWGEHEYRISEWIDMYNRNGFHVEIFSQTHPPILNSILLRINAFRFSLFINKLFRRVKSNHHYLYGFNPTRKLFIATKK